MGSIIELTVALEFTPEGDLFKKTTQSSIDRNA
ncbi:hypothetical protein Hbal_0958 [Hirschia baltica ATCC 49814]|uniref:Uncharacterized protein n=1 Tax=Hirschia baltica (strain ATCC 49814 / DSM 5838 / IFAM 1418) TaxID=582402 RepID=C6XQP6_HIRBI|nr:hypothetical protein Hbal_0958 [Hirschia baltica ATCC 49814]